MKIEEKVIQIVRKKQTHTRNEVRMESTFKSDLSFDALDVIEIIMEVETEYDIEIEDAYLVHMITVADLINEVKRQKCPNDCQ
jgi:acyl carrier protein